MRRLYVLIGVVALAGCGEAGGEGADLGGSRWAAGPDGGGCARPEEGCPCEPGAEPVTCYGNPEPAGGGDLLCHEGAMYCRGGAWSACETLRDYTISLPTALVDGPSPCNPCNPDCSVARDYPTTTDLTSGNSTGVVYDPSEAGITLEDTGTSSTIPDGDGDGVPDAGDECPGTGWRAPCDGSATDDGFYHTLAYGGPTEIDPLEFSVRVRTADVYFLMDTTGSMGGEISNLKSGLRTGTYIAGCPGGIIGAIRCTIPDAWFGVGYHDDYPVNPYGYYYYDRVYWNLQDITSSVTATQTAVNALALHAGSDGPESQSQALYAIASGNGLGSYLGARTGCPAGHWGYPCFRPGTIPIVILFTDAPFHNGPYGYGYSSSTLGFTAPSWAASVGALTAAGVRVITVHSGGSYGHSDAVALANVTGSVSSSGSPYVFSISSSGTGLSDAVVDAVVDLANYSRMDVSARAVDNTATAIDERGFVEAIAAVSFPTGRCTGISGSTFLQCLPGTMVDFRVSFRNDFVMPTTVPQVFDFWIEVVGDGTYVLDTIPVRIVVPPEVPTYPPSGSYWRDYDSTTRCEIPPQRPDWGELSWTASTPPDSRIRFEFRTSDTLAGLPSATPATVTVPPSTSPIDVGSLLVSSGLTNFKPYLRVTAVLLASTDRTVSPTLTGFELQFTCTSYE